MTKVLLKDIIIKNNDLIKGVNIHGLRNKFHKSDLHIMFKIMNVDDETFYFIILLDEVNKIALRKNHIIKNEEDVNSIIELYNYYNKTDNVTIEELLNNGYEYVKFNDVK